MRELKQKAILSSRKRNGLLTTPYFCAGETAVRAVKNFADPELTKPSIAFIPHSKGKVE